MNKKVYFITGATGFVGSLILKQLIEEDATSLIYLLIRRKGSKGAEERAARLCKELFKDEAIYQDRVIALEGSITEDELGLVDEHYKLLSTSVNEIFHSAATIKFNLPSAKAESINVKGTQELLKLSQHAYDNKTLERVNYISTAYVVGKIHSAKGEAFSNSYESSKFKAEGVVGEYIKAGLPVVIYRPSIISGDATTGLISETSIIYKFLLMLSKQTIPILPGAGGNTSLNIISIDYFMGLMFAIRALPESIGNTYNITNSKNVDFEELITHSCRLLNVATPDFVNFDHVERLSKRVLAQIGAFMPYLEQCHFFDTSKTKEILQLGTLPVDDVLKGMDKIVDFCLKKGLLKPSH